MMSEIGRRLRRLFEEIAPQPDLAAIQHSDVSPRRPQWVPAAALVALVAGVTLAVVLLSRDGSPPVTETTTTTTGTTVPGTETTVATPTTVAAAPSSPGFGGVVRIGVELDRLDEPGTGLNPLLTSGGGAHHVARLVVPGAYRVDPATGDLTPWAVVAIPAVDNGLVEVGGDGSVTVTYRIRDEAVWEDGTPMTATDLAFTLEVASGLDLTESGGPGPPWDLVDPGSVVANGKTLTLRLRRPDPRYVLLFEWILPAHAIAPATFDADWRDRLWLSGGPFRFVSYERSSQVETVPSRIVLERNPNYWEVDPITGDALPYLDGVEFVMIHTMGMDSIAVPLSLLRDGEIDAMVAGLPAFVGVQLDGQQAAGLAVTQVWDTLFEVMLVNTGEGRLVVNADSLNHDLEYRRAVLAAVDRAALAGERGPRAAFDRRVVSSMTGLGMPAWDHGVWDRYDDPARATAFAAAHPGALRVVYVSTTGDITMDIGDAVVDLLGAAGWEASAEYGGFERILTGDYDLGALRLFGASQPAGLGPLLLFTLFDPFGEDPIVDWRSVGEPAVRFHELLTEAAGEVDRNRLGELLRAAEAILADQAIVYPLVERQPTYYVHRPERLQGLTPIPGAVTFNTAYAAWWWSPEG
jgi:ABC-type transport system substrate-binding protein